MSREKEGYRDTLAQLNEMFPNKGMLTRKEVAQFMGVTRQTLWRRGIAFNEKTNLVTKADLARQICV